MTESGTARVISAGWVSRSISPHAHVRDNTDYGYLWWLQTFRAAGRDFKCFAMYGSGGNKVCVFPGERLVVVVTIINYKVPGAGALADQLLVEKNIAVVGPTVRGMNDDSRELTCVFWIGYTLKTIAGNRAIAISTQLRVAPDTLTRI